ncbi:MAG TPA: hypothetical protein ENG63_04940 [Candidatus Desulfofervidus auxilii]|uniref:Glycosyltransferase family 25 protein n=1 Tax=Desulfofervidus auxilii TaxID=1621989 RepID=A0A7C0Y5J4_DESA2|nr:hypothetical protein [Candidatus Desulfofervidus auxilii]
MSEIYCEYLAYPEKRGIYLGRISNFKIEWIDSLYAYLISPEVGRLKFRYHKSFNPKFIKEIFTFKKYNKVFIGIKGFEETPEIDIGLSERFLYPKVLVCCCLYRNNLKVIDNILKAIKYADINDIECDILFMYSDPYPQFSPFYLKNIAFKLEKARKIAIRENYDYMMLIEDDVLVPEDAIVTLLDYSHVAPVVAGYYKLYKGDYFGKLCGKKQKGIWLTENDIKNKDFVEVWLTCFGCTLISKIVFRNIAFTTGIDGDFANKCDEFGFKRIIIPKVFCGHIDEEGKIIR